MSIQGKVIVFTGRISKPRHEFQKLVEEHGGIAGSDVSSKTDYLVVGEKPGSKLVRATILHIPILSEEEFLRLIQENINETEEAPLTSAELNKVNDHTLTLQCLFCGREYKQFDNIPNRETCPLCEILSYPVRCPHCKDTPVYISDFNLYHCMFCGTWFRAPYSLRMREVKHHHLYLSTKNPYVRKCPCGATIKLTDEDIEYKEKRYEEAPQQVDKIEREGRIWDFIHSLSPEQIAHLEEKYYDSKR